MVAPMERKSALRKPAAAILGMSMIFLLAAPSMAEEPTAAAKTPASSASFGECSELAALLAEQDEKNTREFRQIKRDLAALAQQVEEPGLSEILGGIGYILGLFGMAAYVASRKKGGGGGR